LALPGTAEKKRSQEDSVGADEDITEDKRRGKDDSDSDSAGKKLNGGEVPTRKWQRSATRARKSGVKRKNQCGHVEKTRPTKEKPTGSALLLPLARCVLP